MAEENINNNSTGTENNNNNNNDTENKNTDTGDKKTYTQEEVLDMLQRECDRRVADALKKQEKKFQKQMSLSKLDGDERERAEKDDKIAELEAQLAEFRIEKNKSELKSTLAARGLDAQFADLLNIGDDTEENQKLISDFDKLFKRAVNAEVEKRISGTNIKGNNNINKDTGAMTVEKYNKMTVGEATRYLNSNPEFKEVLKSQKF